MNLVTSERRRLDGIASDSWYAKGPNAASTAYSFRIFSRHFRGRRCLEMGPAEGLMTAQLYEHSRSLRCWRVQNRSFARCVNGIPGLKFIVPCLKSSRLLKNSKRLYLDMFWNT